MRKFVGLRDRALIGVMTFSFARIGAVLGMNVEDHYWDGKRWWFRLHEKGGKHHDVPETVFPIRTDPGSAGPS